MRQIVKNSDIGSLSFQLDVYCSAGKVQALFPKPGVPPIPADLAPGAAACHQRQKARSLRCRLFDPEDPRETGVEECQPVAATAGVVLPSM
jgi:hypothetical protein